MITHSLLIGEGGQLGALDRGERYVYIGAAIRAKRAAIKALKLFLSMLCL
jgi:hypothetical protein